MWFKKPEDYEGPEESYKGLQEDAKHPAGHVQDAQDPPSSMEISSLMNLGTVT